MYDRALSAFYLEETDRIPFFNVTSPVFTRFGRRISGVDPFKNCLKATSEYLKRTDIDFTFQCGISEIDEKTKKIHERAKTEGTVYADYDGPLKDKWRGLKVAYTWLDSVNEISRWIAERPFKTLDELESFLEDYDPCARLDEVGPDGVYEYAPNWHELQESVRESTLVPGFYYFKLWQSFLVDIGWTLLVRLIYQRPKTFAKFLERYLEYSLKITEAFATMTDIEVFVSHDDIATANGVMMSPKWLRDNIISKYQRVWAPLKRKGVKVVFVSDGDYTDVLDEISKYADGFWFDNSNPCQKMDFKNVVRKYGDSKVIMSASDTIDWAHSAKSKGGIDRAIRQCVSEAGHCPGYFLPFGGGGDDDVTVSLSEFYWKTALKYCRRKKHGGDLGEE